MKKVYKIILVICIMIIAIENNIYASNINLEVINRDGQIKKLDNDQGYISKKVIDTNEETGEITIELKLSNTSEDEQKRSKTEVIFVVDNSSSMSTATNSGMTRKKMISNAIKTLTEQIYAQNSSVYMGLVKFSTTASTISKLTNDKQTIINGISTYENSGVEGETNISLGLTIANDSFSSDCKNKIIILLTDGTPSNDRNGTNTKNTLTNVAKSGTYVISMITGIKSSIITNIFGTPEEPTTGKLYNIEDTSIDTIISQDIYKDIIQKTQASITDINIVDYFPKDIIENCDFSYISKPNIGTISDSININDKNIVWHIDLLKGGEEDVVQYKIKIKDKDNSNLINKVTPTNEKVILTYKDFNSEEHEVILDSSPKIKMLKNEQVVQDNTVKDSSLPATGNSFEIIIAIIATVVISYILWKSSKKVY